MSRTGRVLTVLAAWLLPVAWVTVALLAGPSDGTLVSSSVLTRSPAWGTGITVVDAPGDGPLRIGDVVLAVDGSPIGDTADRADPPREVGDELTYRVRRPAPGLARDLSIDVTLIRYPVSEVLSRHAAVVLGFIMVLTAASVVFWRCPRAGLQRSLLAAGALLPCSLTVAPLGLGVIDLAGSRGVWPQVGGGLLGTLGLGACVVAAACLAGPSSGLPRTRRLLPLALAPFAGYAVWALSYARDPAPAPDRLQALVTVVPPALVVAVPLTLGLVVLGHVRAATRHHRLAARLVLVALVGGLSVRLLLVDVPRLVSGRPLLPTDAVVLLLTPAVVAGVAIAVDGHRVEEIEPTVRRAVVEALAAALVASSFLAVAAGVGRASDIEVRSLLAGGVVALLVLPLAVALQRGLRRSVYGDREFPRRVVAELRRLDVSSDPADALAETLTLLARRLRLSYAAIEARPAGGGEPLVAAIGQSRGRPVSVDLIVGGSALGSLSLEVAPERDPLGRGDRRLLEDVGGQVGALVQTVLANRELQHSRQRLVTAREEERRRLQRDLHDGLGPSLASLAMQLEAVPDLIPDDPAAATDLVERLAARARADIVEVRRLVEGLRPPVLDQLGLVSALRQRAEEQQLPDAAGARMTWTIEADDDVEPLPAAVEVAAYRIALEAVTNALRHSGAATCTVSLRRDDGALVLRVRDTGRGLAADPGTGVGLTSMRERAEELGGTCVVTSDAQGTLVEARLPFPTTDGG